MSVSVKLVVERTAQTISCKATSNGQDYTLQLPLASCSFFETVAQITFKPEYQRSLAILSGSSQECASIEEFYRSEEQLKRFFGVTVTLNHEDLALRLLSESDTLLAELDKLKFQDLLKVLKGSYNGFATKLHNKANRRIKKYLGITTRSASQKQQLKQLLQLIKAESTEEEPSDDQAQISKKAIAPKKQIKYQEKVESKKEEKPSKIVKNEENEAPKVQSKEIKAQVSQKVEIPIEKEKEILIEDNDADQEEEQEKPRGRKEHPHFYKEIHREKKPKKHDHKRHQDDENDWEDVKEEKDNKRKQKNIKKKHLKEDVPEQEEQEREPEQEQESRSKKKPKKAKEENKAYDPNKQYFPAPKDKVRKQVRVLLGINGDSEDGWRERYRVLRAPAKADKSEGKPNKPQKEEKEERQAKGQNSKKKQRQKEPSKESEAAPVAEQKPQISSEPTIIKVSENAKQLRKIFTFPEDGKGYKLDPEKQYKLFVNSSFWINLQKDKITIQKGDKGYIRMGGKFMSSDDYLLEAEDLTLSFTALCNLQDGGIPFNNPKVEDFTGNGQWFHLQKLEIYAYE